MRLLGYVMSVVREMASKTVRHRGCDTVTTVERWIATGECGGSLAVDELIAVLLDQRQHWTDRAWSVMLLASRNEKAATEALFHATQLDPVYWVRRDALRSLRRESIQDASDELAVAAKVFESRAGNQPAPD